MPFDDAVADLKAALDVLDADITARIIIAVTEAWPSATSPGPTLTVAPSTTPIGGTPAEDVAHALETVLDALTTVAAAMGDDEADPFLKAVTPAVERELDIARLAVTQVWALDPAATGKKPKWRYWSPAWARHEAARIAADITRLRTTPGTTGSTCVMEVAVPEAEVGIRPLAFAPPGSPFTPFGPAAGNTAIARRRAAHEESLGEKAKRIGGALLGKAVAAGTEQGATLAIAAVTGVVVTGLATIPMGIGIALLVGGVPPLAKRARRWSGAPGPDERRALVTGTFADRAHLLLPMIELSGPYDVIERRLEEAHEEGQAALDLWRDQETARSGDSQTLTTRYDAAAKTLTRERDEASDSYRIGVPPQNRFQYLFFTGGAAQLAAELTRPRP
jgi:hypothetical protein